MRQGQEDKQPNNHIALSESALALSLCTSIYIDCVEVAGLSYKSMGNK